MRRRTTASHSLRDGCALAIVLGVALSATASAQQAADPSPPPLNRVAVERPLTGGDKLLLTSGVSQIEGSAGGGLSPWALIGGYGTRDQIGANAYWTNVAISDYRLESTGVLLGAFDRVEVSLARQRLDTRAVGAALGLGRGYVIGQDVFGAKLRVAGNAVLDQDRWLPQLAIGFQHKRNDRGDLLRAIGARSAQGTDLYISATRLFLERSLLVDATVRFTRANQIGLLGFGGDRHDGYRPQFEFAAASLLSRHLAIGVEYRMKPDNLRIAEEDDWYDLFLAWAPTKHVSLTLAYADLGTIAIADHQRGVYTSLQFGF